jgi:hypothetical protein
VNELLPLPERSPSRPPSEAEARVRLAAGLQAVRELTGSTVEEWARRWGAALGREITPGLVEGWEDPTGPKPPMHWAMVAIALGGPEAVGVISRLLFA